MNKKERYSALLAYFTQHYPQPETELQYSNPFELLVAVILSAQCTDKRVNMVTPPLLAAFPDAYALANADFDTLFPYVRSISYPNNKTKHLLGMAKMLVNDFNGEVPASVESLVKLPGVGRKTANVILSVVYNQPAMAVDTHVYRVSKRLGLVTQTAKTPLEVEKQLVRYIPKDLIPKAHHWLILHGRYTCLARTPQCHVCSLTAWCAYYQKNTKPQVF